MLYAFDRRYGTCKFVWYSVVHTLVNKIMEENDKNYFGWKGTEDGLALVLYLELMVSILVKTRSIYFHKFRFLKYKLYYSK
jgi:hypothetical protein